MKPLMRKLSDSESFTVFVFVCGMHLSETFGSTYEEVLKDKYNIEENIRNENMIWDSSKLFTQAYINDSRHMAPIPSVINSSKINISIKFRIVIFFN